MLIFILGVPPRNGFSCVKSFRCVPSRPTVPLFCEVSTAESVVSVNLKVHLLRHHNDRLSIHRCLVLRPLGPFCPLFMPNASVTSFCSTPYSFSRNLSLSILPCPVLGSSERNSMILGYLCPPNFSLQNATSSFFNESVPAKRSCRTM